MNLDNYEDNYDLEVKSKKRDKNMFCLVYEINRFVPKSHDQRRMNPVTEQMRTAIGR